MKIALLRPLPDPRRWSMDLYSREIAKALKSALNAGDEVIVFPSDEEAARWKVVGCGPASKIQRWFQQYFCYGFAAARLKADIYHVTDHGYAHVLPFLTKKKTVVTFHDALLPRLGQKKLPVSWFPRTAIWAQNFCLMHLKNAQRIVTVSEFSKKELLEVCLYQSPNVIPVYHGLDPIFGKSAYGEAQQLRADWGLENKKVVLLPGRSDAHKNMEGSLRVFSKMIRDCSIQNAVLLKIGDPFTAAQRKLIRELGITGEIVEKEGVPFSWIPAVYQLSDAVLFLSWYEGFGLPVLEAMASGVPILISNRGSLPEVSGGFAPTADPEDEQSASDLLGRLLTDVKFRSSFIDNGKDWVSRFCWKKTAEQLIKIYREIL